MIVSEIRHFHFHDHRNGIIICTVIKCVKVIVQITVILMCYVNEIHAILDEGELTLRSRIPQFIHTSQAKYQEQRKATSTNTQAWREDAVH